jgi:hypothetical protein
MRYYLNTENKIIDLNHAIFFCHVTNKNGDIKEIASDEEIKQTKQKKLDFLLAEGIVSEYKTTDIDPTEKKVETRGRKKKVVLEEEEEEEENEATESDEDSTEKDEDNTEKEEETE